MMASVMIPGSVLTVPQYVLFASMGWTESALPLTIPTLFGGGAMNIFLMVQFMRNIPYEIENAAKIDGANVFQRYLLITIPLCVPILILYHYRHVQQRMGRFYRPARLLEGTLAMDDRGRDLL